MCRQIFLLQEGSQLLNNLHSGASTQSCFVTCGEAYRSRRAFYCVVRRPSVVISSLVALWLRLGYVTSQERWLLGKFDFLGKCWLPWEKLTPLGKVDSLGKSWLPRENLTSSGKVDFLWKSCPENVTPWEYLLPGNLWHLDLKVSRISGFYGFLHFTDFWNSRTFGFHGFLVF